MPSKEFGTHDPAGLSSEAAACPSEAPKERRRKQRRREGRQARAGGAVLSGPKAERSERLQGGLLLSERGSRNGDLSQQMNFSCCHKCIFRFPEEVSVRIHRRLVLFIRVAEESETPLVLSEITETA